MTEANTNETVAKSVCAIVTLAVEGVRGAPSPVIAGIGMAMARYAQQHDDAAAFRAASAATFAAAMEVAAIKDVEAAGAETPKDEIMIASLSIAKSLLMLTQTLDRHMDHHATLNGLITAYVNAATQRDAVAAAVDGLRRAADTIERQGGMTGHMDMTVHATGRA